MTIQKIIQEALEKIHKEHGVMITEIYADYIDTSHPLSNNKDIIVNNIKFTGTAND